MSEDVKLTEGFSVTIKRIAQWQTYSGLLEGLPTEEMNARILQDVREEAKKFCFINEVFVVEPEQEPVPYEGRYPFGTPATLPDVCCIALLHYHRSFRDKGKDYSELAVVWFQKKYAFPIDADVVVKIQAIPFSEVCGEFHY
jgi:hypothetical protein